MKHRPFGRTGWQVSEIGYGMWGMAGWTGSDDAESLEALELAVSLGCNFFDTAWAYGQGHSERLLGRLLMAHPDKRLYVATKVPPKNLKWVGLDDHALDDVFPADHILEYTEKSLENLGVDAIDLQLLHAWSDRWATDERWQRAASDLQSQGLVRAFGISVNRWEPASVLRALDTGLVAAVQVVYNIFDQAPEDELFHACEEKHVAVIARVPFDEGSLTGRLRPGMTWPEGDWRNLYFTPDNLRATLDRVERLGPLAPQGMELPEMALRFILEHPAVSTTIPGMRKPAHVRANMAASDGERLPARLYDALRQHRWDRGYLVP